MDQDKHIDPSAGEVFLPLQLLLQRCQLLLELLHFSSPLVGLLDVSVQVSVQRKLMVK